jgi:hypothetical protein
MNDDEFDKRRRQRAIVTAVILAGVAALFYFITLARIGQGAMSG